MTPDQYRRHYLEPAMAMAAPAAAMPELPAYHWYPLSEPPRPVGLADLFSAGVRCGHGETLAHLESRAREFDDAAGDLIPKLEWMSSELKTRERELVDFGRAHTEHVNALQAAIDAARARIVEVESSTFWRLTAPLRYVVHRGKLAARHARGLGHQARLLPPRLGVARQIVRDEGAVALLRRVRSKLGRRASASALRKRPGLERAIGPLEVPASPAPRVSVIVPTYGQDLHTFTCLKALAREAARVPLEVIVMDDAAPTPAAHALSAVKGVRFVRNDTNLGFLANSNKGASLARGSYLLFLNNDAIVGEGSIQAMLDVFAQEPDAGAVGAKLVYPDGSLQEAGGIVWRDGSAWNYGRGEDPSKPEFEYLREADYCSGACLLVPRALFEELGGFDTTFAPAYYEDTDLCFQVRAAGRKVYYQPAAEVVHFEGVSHGTSVTEGAKAGQVANRQRFYDKWRTTLAAHRVNGLYPRLERDRGARRRVLFVEACMLTPDQDSGSVRTWWLLKVMRGQGCKVTFVADNLEHRQPYASRLAREGVEVLHHPHVDSIEGYIEDHGSEFDMIVLARYYVASRYIDAVRRHAPQALLVFDTLDLHFLRTQRLAALEDSRTLSRSAETIRGQELDCIRRSDVTWVVSPVEKEVLAAEVPGAHVVVQTNVHQSSERIAPFSGREGIVFVGGYRHPPNVDAALYFAREILPLLRERLPDAVTYLIGSNPPPAVRDLAQPGLEVVGYVPDLEPWFDRARLSISPLRYGAGVKGKVNHAMSHGLPMVATPPSVEGMHLVDGKDVLIAEDPAAFAEAVASLYRDEALWTRLSEGGLANVREHFSPEAAVRALEATFAYHSREPQAPGNR